MNNCDHDWEGDSDPDFWHCIKCDRIEPKWRYSLQFRMKKKMINILCKLLGHKWSNRGLIKAIDGEEKVVFKCRRCEAERISSFTLVGTTRRAVGRLKEEK